MDGTSESDLDWSETEHGDVAFRRKKLAAAAGGERLGCSLYEVDPGDRMWPYHYHTGNEEALYVLDGEGTLRTEEGERPLDAGDFVAFPEGPAGAHQVVNDADGTLRLLVVSTMDDPDVTVYPESGKFGVYAGSAPGSDEPRSVHGYYRLDDDVDYWEGED